MTIEINKKNICIAVGVILLLFLIVFSFMYYKNHKTEPEIITVPSTNVPDIKSFFPKETNSTIKDLSNQTTRAKKTQAPIYKYYTITQEAADKKAQEYANSQKVDKVVKETRKKEIIDSDTNLGQNKVIENNYYGINLERKHKIKAGAAIIDNSQYISVSYQNRKMEYTAYANPNDNKYGVGVSYTIAQW